MKDKSDKTVIAGAKSYAYVHYDKEAADDMRKAKRAHLIARVAFYAVFGTACIALAVMAFKG